MDLNHFQLARAALDDLNAGFQLGIAVTRSGDRVVRVNVSEDTPDSVVKLIHRRLEKIPHEIRRVYPAQLESAPR